MSGNFDVDVQQIQQVTVDWTTETGAKGKLPGRLSSIESHLSSLLERSFLQDVFDPAAEFVQTGIWFALRDSLKKSSGELNTLVQPVQEDARLLKRCSIEYQIADDAAAHHVSDIQSTLSSHAPGSAQIRVLLNQLGWSGGGSVTSGGGAAGANGGGGSGGSTGGGGGSVGNTTGSRTAGIHGPRNGATPGGTYEPYRKNGVS